MPLVSGTRLGPYEILSPLGAGGMGEVYRARDTRLDRTVAIKILPAHLSDNPEARQRFDREARAISSLNHPNICTLYDVGHQDGTDYLVMEYLEGETLADRLRKGPLPPEQVLKHGTEICEGLEKAHRSGVVHRDLKPGNIMLTKAGAKLMDFGLAKAVSTGSPPSSGLTATLLTPEVSQPLTAQGTVVGTFQYMAPEQVEGREADVRSDIFALGAVLYEMATGRAAFSGKTQASVVAAILASEPAPVSTIQPMSPPALDRVIKTCLAKDPEERLQTVHDVKLQLRWIAEAGSQAGVPVPATAPRSRREWLGWVVATLLALAGVTSAILVWLHTQPPKRVALAVLAAPGVTFNFSGLFGPPAISPDGSRIVMVGSDSSSIRSLYLRFLDRTTLLPLQGTSGASYPFWSPDGKQIGFFTSDSLKVVDVSSGSILQVCSVAEGRGGTWNERGDIVFGTRTTGLLRVPASGGTPAVVTTLSPREANHRFPTFLPDGEHVAFVVQNVGAAQVHVASLSDRQASVLAGVVSNVAFRDGRIFHVRPDGTLLAQRFDEKHFSLQGDPEVVAKPVGYDGQFNYAAFGVSAGGAIAYEEGSGSTSNELVAYDRAGKEVGKLPALTTEFSGSAVRISPVGDRILYSTSGGTRNDLWVQPSHGSRTRISLGPDGGTNGIWSPDGAQVAYQNGIGGDSLLVRASDGQGSERVVLKMEGEVIPRSWSADGKYVVFEFHAVANPNSPGEIWVAPVRPGQTAPHALLRNVASYGTDLSPDGKWLAYTSNESGRLEVYVIPFNPDAPPDKSLASGRWQISMEGGDQPRWNPRSNELLFTNPSRTTLFAAAIKASAGRFESGEIRKLFDLPLHPAWAFFDIGPQGTIYMFRYVGRQTSPLTVLLNWRPAEK